MDDDLSKLKLLYYSILDFQKGTLEYINKYFDVLTLPDPSRDSDEILKKAKVIWAPMGFVFGKDKIDKCLNLSVIGTATTGVPHIDVDYAQRENVSVCSLKDQQPFLSTITPTAELAWGLVLAVTRRIPWAYDSVCEGKWNPKEFGRRTPRMLSEMTLGIVGLGRLGSWVAKYGKAFKMRVLYYDPLVTYIQYIKCATLHDLAKESDIVSIHVHLTENTVNLIDRQFIQTMPKGSYIINTARGGILDEDALLEALQSGHLGGAGLDMLKGEHLPGFKEGIKEHPLVQYARTHDNLILTPKMGGCTVDAWEKTERRVVDLILQELRKKGEM